MATRKNGNGSSSADVGSERPGAYVKVSGSRRRRKGKRGSTVPPPGASADDEAGPSIVDTVGEETDSETSTLGSGGVDDLRRPSRPSESRAPHREVGPLGIDDVREDPIDRLISSNPPRERVPSDSPRVRSDPSRLNVVEINATGSRYNGLFDEDEDAEEPEVDARDRELAREYEIGFGADAPDPDERDREARERAREREENEAHDRRMMHEVRASLRPAQGGGLVRRDEGYDDRHSLSSVFDARPSLRPSPPPEKERDPTSVLWWVAVIAFTAIIAAAVAIAAREQFEDAPLPTVQQAPTTPPTAVPAAFEAPKRPTVSFGGVLTEQQAPAEAKPAEKPAEPKPRMPAPQVAPTANGAASRNAAAPAKAATAVGRPNPAGPATTAAPVERKPAARPAAPAQPPSYAPGYNKALGAGESFAPGYRPVVPESGPNQEPAAAQPRPAPRPAVEHELPINPYE